MGGITFCGIFSAILAAVIGRVRMREGRTEDSKKAKSREVCVYSPRVRSELPIT